MTKTTLWLDAKTRDKIMSLRNPGESADDVLNRLLPQESAYSTLDILKKRMAEDAEIKAREIYMQKIRDYNAKHSTDYEENKAKLGLDGNKKSDYWLKSKIEKDK